MYCIKCDKIFCSNCILKHLKINDKNQTNLNKGYIIKNNEKFIKCLLHLKEKNLAFCLKCNTHIFIEYNKNRKHINLTKNNILEVSVTNEMENILNGIINIYKRRIKQFNKEKKRNRIA